MKINTHIGNVDIKIDTSRITERNLKNAQRKLDEAVLNDTTPYVPKGGTGYLRGSGHIADGGGEIIWNGPYAHFQYIGYVRTDERGRVFVGKDEKKPILTDRPLKYQEPGASSRWFEESKKKNLQSWIDAVKKEMGKE